MRPDAVNWSTTNELATLEFSPRALVARRLMRYAFHAALTQAVLGVVICWVAWRVGLPAVARWERWPAVVAWWERALSLIPPAFARDAGALALVAGSQLAALVIAQLALRPLIGRTLSRHTAGLRDLFGAISTMASGVMPKPLPAGGSGETGYLAMAFNDMTGRLIASRKSLIEANENLERRVAERTRELREAAEKLERMASTDAMTGLANRRALTERGEELFADSIRGSSDLVCFVIDLDNFKGVNDTLGHKVGDELIRLAADALRAGSRGNDLPARLGGDEFILFMPMTEPEAAAAVADRLQADFRRRAGELLKGHTLERMPSMSIGITSRRQAGAMTFEELVQRADAALYCAKARGKGRAEVFAGPKQNAA
jgi:diguanylate cyclase (GGDEF)-like protein